MGIIFIASFIGVSIMLALVHGYAKIWSPVEINVYH